MPGRKPASPKPNKPQPARGKGKSQSAPAARKPAARPAVRTAAQTARRRVPTGISPERKLDAVGILLALVGLVMLLSLLSVNKGSLTGWLTHLLAQGLGWGMYLLPLGLLGIGLWLVLRNIERLPQFSVERLSGIFLLFLNLLAWLHLLAGGNDTLAESGQGGGAIGNLILGALVSALGTAGAVIALLAWLLIALTMALDLSIPEIFRWLSPLAARFKAAWESLGRRLEQSGRADLSA